jgi:hypothetical protein
MNCVFLTNIPTPYRVSMWNQLTMYSNRVQKNFSVLFMNRTEPNRDWIIEDEINFSHKIWDMKILKYRNYYFRLSISYIFSAIKYNNNIIIKENATYQVQSLILDRSKLPY